MKSKKIISGLLALTFVLGGTALPNTVVNNSVSASASEEAEVLTFGDFEYTLLEDGTVEIVKYMDDEAKEVEIPSEIDGVAVTSIGGSAFDSCYNLVRITLPNSLKLIKLSAFDVCGIESIVIPDSVEDIEAYAFADCDNLKSVTLSKNLKNINDSTFNGCSNLDNIVIPDGVKSIGERAFSYCTHLKSVTIPKSVTEIGEDAFGFTDPVTINCYSGSYAEKYAKENGLNYKLIDEKLPACPPPNLLRAEYSSEYHQIRFRWDPIKGAEKYGIAVYLSGKWRVWTNSIPASTTTFTTPKNLTPGTKYKVAVAAKVNGKWDTSDPIKKAITVTVK